MSAEPGPAGKLKVVLPPLAAATWRQMRAGDKVTGEVLAVLGDGRYRVKVAGRDTLCESPLAFQPGDRLKLVVGKAGGKIELKVMIEPPAEQAAGVELAKLKLPTDRIHKQVAAALTAAGTPLSPETVPLLARLAKAWGLTRPAEYRTLIAQWRLGYPLQRDIFDHLRAAERPWPKAARQLPTPPGGPGVTPERFDPSYWDRLGITRERRLARRAAVPRDTLRDQLRQGAATDPALGEVLFKLEGKTLAAAAPAREPDAPVVLPLLFTGAPDGMAGELIVEPDAGPAAAGQPRRPKLTLALALSRLGELTVDLVPQGNAGYAIGFSGADAGALAWLEKNADELRRALAPLLPATVSFTAAPAPAPAGGPATAGGIDFQA